RHSMDKEHVKGAADKVSGATKEAAGKMTDDEKLEAEGKLDKAKGAARDFIGDVKDEARRAAKDTKH
ncbi:MAG TPA: CsbD family protein, partial [Vitreimonas sp.]|nr:CsbD family protein [Vitreimonas sp.]